MLVGEGGPKKLNGWQRFQYVFLLKFTLKHFPNIIEDRISYNPFISRDKEYVARWKAQQNLILSEIIKSVEE